MMSAPAPSFERDYFERNYRNYARQNPPRKLNFYRGLVEAAVAGRPLLVRGARRALLGAGVCLAVVALLDIVGVSR